MKRILIIANTYYQLIFAIQMQQTIFKNDEIILLLSDHSKNTKMIVERLKKYNVFSQAFFIESKGLIENRNHFDKLIDNFAMAFLEHNRYSYYLNEVKNQKFDELICFNYGMDSYGIFSTLYKYNPNLKISLFEEGLLSYDIKITTNLQRELIKKIRRIRGKRDISEMINNFYCFYPEIYRGSIDTVQVPTIDIKSDTANILKEIFEIKEENLNYEQKYIYFTSVYDFEGGQPIGEFEIALELRDLVGNENLLIKQHPRDIRDIYIKNGFNVDDNSSIPWEVIQISHDFSKNIFLTATSGSVLAGSFLSEKPIPIGYLFNLCNIESNEAAKKSIKDIQNLLQGSDIKDSLKNIAIINNLEQCLNMGKK